MAVCWEPKGAENAWLEPNPLLVAGEPKAGPLLKIGALPNDAPPPKGGLDPNTEAPPNAPTEFCVVCATAKPADATPLPLVKLPLLPK